MNAFVFVFLVHKKSPLSVKKGLSLSHDFLLSLHINKTFPKTEKKKQKKRKEKAFRSGR